MSVKVVHSLPGRIRIDLPELKKNPSLSAVITRVTKQLPGIREVHANPLTGRVMVVYAQDRLAPGVLLKFLNKITSRTKGKEPRGLREEERVARKPIEPEDLPIRRQWLNVALGGGVLAYLGLKHSLYGRTALAQNAHIFNVAAVTAIISGYPVLRSGFQGLAKGKINHDLLISGLALGTILLRESVPGLLVLTLANLTALGQSLVFRNYRKMLPQLPGARPETRETSLKWDEAGQEYGRKVMLPTLGMASLAGLTGGKGGFQRSLAMLLAANPSPAGISAATAVTTVMAKGSKKGIFFREPRTLERLCEVDTVIFSGTEIFNNAMTYCLGDLFPTSDSSKEQLKALIGRAAAENRDPFSLLLKRVRNIHYKARNPGSKSGTVLVGDEETFVREGIEIREAAYKARRMRHLSQMPLYVAFQGKLVGVVGIQQSQASGLRQMIRELRALGMPHIGLFVKPEHAVLKQTVRELGLTHVWCPSSPGEKLEIIRKLSQQGRKVAVVMDGDEEPKLSEEALLSICLSQGLSPVGADVLMSDLPLLPEAFRLALRAEQRAKQNLALVRAANAVGMTLGAMGWLSPMSANVYNNLTSIAVGANSLRLLSGRKNRRRMDDSVYSGTKGEIAAALAAEEGQALAKENHLQPYQCSNWHSLSVEEILHKLKTDLAEGLTGHEVHRRIAQFGFNKMQEEKPSGFWQKLWGQFKDFLVKTLVASAGVCALLGEFGDALAITSILVINAVLGVLQEQKAEGALRALNKMTAPTARVKRNGKILRVSAGELVPGDVVLLEQGDGVPADLRLIEAHGLEVEESALTGEAYPVVKKATRMADCIPLLDCENLVFMGTNITRGKATGLVIATGMSTEIGKIAGMLNQQEQEPTPLQNRMAQVGGVILKYCLTVSGLVVLAGILRGGSLFKMFLTGVSLAVAAIPEGLPAVVTIALASGVRRMARENAIVRRLPAVETLGSATLICTDKTGTLTQNRQQIQAAYTGGQWWQAQMDQPMLKPLGSEGNPEDLRALLTAGILCNDANLLWNRPGSAKEKSHWRVDGDPTEGALLLAAVHQEINYKELREKWCRIREMPFDAERLRMTALCREEKHGTVAFIKGAPEMIIQRCTQMQRNGGVAPLTLKERAEVMEANEKMTGEAMRVLAMAYKPLPQPELEDPEEDLVLLGLVGMVDPPRPGVKEAVATCHRAGIKVAMITGDHPHTALAIARMVGITDNSRVLTGSEMDRLNDYELTATIRDIRVFARVLPGQKLRLVKAFRSQGEILAMVGDGINDAPAVKEGDIGVAMGKSGTDVTKQAADIVLADDNFTTLVSAVEQGRGIYGNIRRSVRYLLATNVGLVLIVFLAVLLGLEMPLLPIQLLFLNVLGDGLPALALGVEPPTPRLMKQPPRSTQKGFFDNGLGRQIFTRGVATGLVGLETYHRVLKQGDLGRARTVLLASFITSKLLFSLECSERSRKEKYSRYLLGSLALSAVLLAGALYLPVGRRIFKTSSLGPADLITVFGASGVTYIFDKFLTASWQSRRLRQTKKNIHPLPIS